MKIKNHTLHCLLYCSLVLFIIPTLTHAAEVAAKAQTEVIYYLFSGTISEEKNQLIFSHCTLAKDQYTLQFNHEEDEKRIRSLLKQEPDFWLNLRASAYTVNEERSLLVNGIAEVHPKMSCHLSKLLSDLNKS